MKSLKVSCYDITHCMLRYRQGNITLNSSTRFRRSAISEYYSHENVGRSFAKTMRIYGVKKIIFRLGWISEMGPIGLDSHIKKKPSIKQKANSYGISGILNN